MNSSGSFIAIIIFLSVTMTGLTPGSAHAQPGTETGGTFGLGAMLGEPSGVSVKIWNNQRSAFGIGAAWSLTGDEESLYMNADYLIHDWFTDTENLAFYYGLGGRIIFTDDPNIGVRVPLGLNFVFDEIPFDLFVEAAPILDVSPDVELAGNGAAGIRYYF